MPISADQGLLVTSEEEAMSTNTNIAERPTETNSGTVTANRALPQMLFNITEVAEMLRVSERQVKRLRTQGKLPAVMIGGRRVFHRDDLERFIGRRLP